MLDTSRYVPLIVTTEIKFKWTWNVNCTYFSQEIRRLLIIFLYMVRNLNSNWAVFKSNWKMCPCRVLVSFVTRSLFKGTSINDVPPFLAFFDLPTYLCPIMSLLEKAAYLMTSFFVWPTLPKFFLRSNSNYSNFHVGQFFA